MPDPELEANMMFTKAYYIYSWSFTEKTMQRIKILGEVGAHTSALAPP